MMSVRQGLVIAALALTAAGAAAAQVQPPQPAGVLSPEAWWSLDEPRREARFDPLGGRRLSKRDGAARLGFNNGVEPSLYRLWGLQPLQALSVRRSETIFEAWYRPSGSARQAVVRIILRDDGRAFLQGRAGLGCCSPEIARRVDINAELPNDTRQTLLRLRDDPLWLQPRHVVVTEGGEALSSVCVEGASYDLTLVDDRRAVHLRRACDPVELGSVSPALQAVIGAALGRDRRFDAVFASQDFAGSGQAYRESIAAGGGLISDSKEGALVAASAMEAPAASAEAAAQTADAMADAPAEILAADRAFAARSAETTAAQAFREFMDADGLWIVEGREPLRGVDAIFDRLGGVAPETGKLLWEPAEAWASESGDFGASWGRSRFVPLGATEPVAAYRYLTVWRRDSDGRWKGLMDMGVSADDLLKPTPAQNPPPASK